VVSGDSETQTLLTVPSLLFGVRVIRVSPLTYTVIPLHTNSKPNFVTGPGVVSRALCSGAGVIAGNSECDALAKFPQPTRERNSGLRPHGIGESATNKVRCGNNGLPIGGARFDQPEQFRLAALSKPALP